MSDFTPPNRPSLGAGIVRRFEVVIDSFIEVIVINADDTIYLESNTRCYIGSNKLSEHPEKHTPGNQLSWKWLKQL